MGVHILLGNRGRGIGRGRREVSHLGGQSSLHGCLLGLDRGVIAGGTGGGDGGGGQGDGGGV